MRGIRFEQRFEGKDVCPVGKSIPAEREPNKAWGGSWENGLSLLKDLKEAVVKGGRQAGMKRTRGQTRGGSGVCVGADHVEPCRPYTKCKIESDCGYRDGFLFNLLCREWRLSEQR